MKYEIEWGKSFKFEIGWQHLHIIYGVMAFLANFIPKDDDFHKYLKQVESALRKKIIFQEEAKRFHICQKCWKEIDTQKDKFQHNVFESGYEIYQHTECPAVNTNKGYEND